MQPISTLDHGRPLVGVVSITYATPPIPDERKKKPPKKCHRVWYERKCKSIELMIMEMSIWGPFPSGGEGQTASAVSDALFLLSFFFFSKGHLKGALWFCLYLLFLFLCSKQLNFFFIITPNASVLRSSACLSFSGIEPWRQILE